MRISVISFTENGKNLSLRLKESLKGEDDISVDLYRKYRGNAGAGVFPEAGVSALPSDIESWTGGQFALGRPILFIGACGIAVRAVAPHLKSKLIDSPVIVMDEAGQYVIPLVSGHVGGANALAERIARCMGAEAVITTATDINGIFAVDLFAKKNALQILRKEGIAEISGKLLAGEKIVVSVEGMETTGQAVNMPEGIRLVSYPPTAPVDIVISRDGTVLPKAACPLRPKEYAVGVGCKKGKDAADLERCFLSVLESVSLTPADVFAIASVDRKREEKGLCLLAEKYRLPFITFSAEMLRQVSGEFHTSAFVEETVGVDNVCERAALMACGDGGSLILEKQAADGMTMAIAKRQWKPQELDWNTQNTEV